MFFFSTPLAFFALFSIPVLILIYLLRRRFQRQTVSSLMLWQYLAPVSKSGLRVKSFRFPFLFFLELLILFLLIMAATDPMLLFANKSRPLLIILDDSVSMRAKADGISFRDKGIKVIEDTLKIRRFHSIRFILAGKTPRVISHSAKTTSQALDALKAWQCYSPSADLEKAIGLAAQISDKDSLFMVITDHAPSEGVQSSPALPVQWESVGKPVGNVGFVNAVRSATEKERCLLEMANFSDSPAETILNLSIPNLKEGNQNQKKLSFKPREQKRITFELPKPDAILHATLESNDALAEDNKVILYPPPIKKIGVQIEIADLKTKELMEKMIEASDLAFSRPFRYDIVFTDKKEISLPDKDCWIVYLISDKKVAAYQGPFVIDHSHPISKGIFLEGVIWGTGKKEIMPGMPIISIGDIPVLTDKIELSGIHQIYLHVNLNFSTLHQTPAFPAMIWNLLDWRASEMPGQLTQSNFRMGVSVFFVPEKENRDVQLTLPDNKKETVPVINEKVIIEPEKPGIYTIKTGEKEIPFAVNILAPHESDLSDSASGKWGDWKDMESVRRDYSPLAWIFLLLALAGLLVHQICIFKPSIKP